jgi:hypothetical protein
MTRLTINITEIDWQSIINNDGRFLHVTCPLCGEKLVAPFDTRQYSDPDIERQVADCLGRHLSPSGFDTYFCKGVVFVAEYEDAGDFDALIEGVDNKIWYWSKYEDVHETERWLLFLVNAERLRERIEDTRRRIEAETKKLAQMEALQAKHNGS